MYINTYAYMYLCKIYLVYIRCAYAYTYINYNKSVSKFINHMFILTFCTDCYKYHHTEA